MDGTKFSNSVSSRKGNPNTVAFETINDWFSSPGSGDATMQKLKRASTALGLDKKRIEDIPESPKS